MVTSPIFHCILYVRPEIYYKYNFSKIDQTVFQHFLHNRVNLLRHAQETQSIRVAAVDGAFRASDLAEELMSVDNQIFSSPLRFAAS